MQTTIHCRVTSLVMLAFASLSSAASDPPGMPADWTDGYVYANGARLHYYRATPAPSKPVIVMVHGVTDNGLCWTTLTQRLQDDYDVYMIDTRSHGLSDPITPDDDGDTLIEDVVAFVRAQGFEKPLLMGHSMGGATVIRVGAEYPDLARAIIVLDAGIGGPGGGRGRGPRNAEASQSESKQAAPADGAERAATPPAHSADPPRPATLSVAMFGSPEALVAQNNYAYDDLVAKCRRDSPKWDIVDCQYWALSKKQYHGAYSPEMFAVMSGSMRTGDALARIPVPTLILKADAADDQRRTHEDAVRATPHVKLVHIDGAGHNLHHDQLDRTEEVLREFLSGL